MAKEIRAMEKLVSALDELLIRMKEQKRQADILIAELQKNDSQIIRLYPDQDSENDPVSYEI